MNELLLRCQMQVWHGGISFLLTNKANDLVAQPIVFEKGLEKKPTAPSFNLGFEAAQALMDDLWLCGIRPSEGSGSAGALAATQKHLEDMRTLVFHNFPFDIQQKIKLKKEG